MRCFFGNKLQCIFKTPECTRETGINEKDFHDLTNFLMDINLSRRRSQSRTTPDKRSTERKADALTSLQNVDIFPLQNGWIITFDRERQAV
jgi:hypothetical protein